MTPAERLMTMLNTPIGDTEYVEAVGDRHVIVHFYDRTQMILAVEAIG